MRRTLAALALLAALAAPALGAGPKYMPAPTTPGLAASPLYQNATGLVQWIDGVTALPADLVGGATPNTTTGAAGGQTVNPALSTDATSGWPVASFTPTSKILRYTGRGGTSTSGMTLFCVVRYTSGFAYPVQQIGNNGLYLQLVTSSGSSVNWGPGGTMKISGVSDFVTAGHRTLIALTCPAGSGVQTVTGYRYDYDAASPTIVTGTTTFTPGFSATVADMAVNNQAGNGGATFDLYVAGFIQNTISASDFAAMVADPYAFARSGGGFAASPTAVPQGQTTTVTLDGTGTANEVASRFLTNGSTFAITDPSGFGNVPTIASQSNTSETSATLSVAVPAGATVGNTYLIQNVGPKSRYAQILTVGASTAATGYGLSGPTTASINSPSGAFSVTPSPGGASWPAGVVLTPGDGGKGGTFTPSTLSPTGTATAQFTYTPAVTGAITITVANNQSLTSSPASLSVTSSVAALNPGTIAFGAMTATGISGGQIMGDVNITGTAASGGVGPIVYEWYMADRVQDLYYNGVPATTAVTPPASLKLAGVASQSIVIHNMPYQRRYAFARIARDMGQGGAIFDAATWNTTTSPVMVGGFFKALKVGIVEIGDSHTANSSGQSNYGQTAITNGLTSPVQGFVATTTTYAVGGSTILQWQPTSATPFPDAGNTGNLNYLNWALTQAAATFNSAGCEIRLLHLRMGNNVFQGPGPQYLTDSTQFATQAGYYRAIRDAALGFTPKFHAMFLANPTGGMPGQTGSVFASLYIAEDAAKCMDLAADNDTLLRADPFYTAYFHVYSSLYGTTMTPDGIHPSASAAALLWTLDAKAIEYALTRQLRLPTPTRGGRRGITTGGQQ